MEKVLGPNSMTEENLSIMDLPMDIFRKIFRECTSSDDDEFENLFMISKQFTTMLQSCSFAFVMNIDTPRHRRHSWLQILDVVARQGMSCELTFTQCTVTDKTFSFLIKKKIHLDFLGFTGCTFNSVFHQNPIMMLSWGISELSLPHLGLGPHLQFPFPRGKQMKNSVNLDTLESRLKQERPNLKITRMTK